MQRCERLCRAQGFPSFLSTIYADLVPVSASTPISQSFAQQQQQQQQQQQEKSAKDQADQLAIFSLEVSLAETLIGWGVQPVCVAGHSLGHYAACYLAGVLSLSDALFLVARRASLFAQLCMPQTSQMMAIAGCTEDEVEDHIAQARSAATIACYNGPTDHVLSGSRDDLGQLHRHVRAKGIKAKLLEVPFGFHSAHIAPVVDSLLRAAQCVTVSPPKLAITSSVLGRLVLPGEEGIADWIEVGPNPICSPMLRANPTASEMTKLATLKRGADSWSGLISLLGTLWTSGCPVGWKACLLSSGQAYQGCNGLSLSSNPATRSGSGTLTRRSSTFESLFGGQHSSASSSHSHDMFDRDRQDRQDRQDSTEESAARTSFSTPLAHFAAMVRGHRVVGLPVFSASLHGELALEASCAVRKLPCQAAASARRRAVRLSNLVFRAPLVLADNDDTGGQARVCIQLDRDGQRFGVSEHVNDSVRLLMTGDVHIDEGSDGSDMDNDSDAQHALRRLGEMQRERRNDEAGYSTLASAMAYGLFAKRVDYCADFRALQSITLAPPPPPPPPPSGDSRSAEAFGTVRIPLTAASPLGERVRGTVLHPVVHDVMLHSGGFVANESAHLVGASESFIGSRVEEVSFSDAAAIRPDTTYRIHIRVAAHGPREVVAQTHLFDEDGQRVLAWARGVHFRKVPTDKLRESLAGA
ncbi:FabD/lysophospholipase-like protein, partial [Acaromyces ingoldii]